MNFNKYIQHPELLDRETLYALRSHVAMYPCHQTARLLMLKNLYILHDPTFDEELRAAAFFITDRTALFNIAEAGYHTLRKPLETAPDAPGDDTATIINRFIQTSSDGNATVPATVDATIDYMGYLMAQTAAPETLNNTKTDTDNIIDSFLEKDGGKIVIPRDAGNTTPDEVPFENDRDEVQEDFYTESLAKLYVKQGNYVKALEIFRQLNLNNSQKNVYFADQMRFLEKAIAITKGAAKK
ncbi:MAG: tetratricopeptide repeat protein [Prevotella sp.]|nr:tetratricopeptide repeat protein [Prevotella sp.]